MPDNIKESALLQPKAAPKPVGPRGGHSAHLRVEGPGDSDLALVERIEPRNEPSLVAAMIRSVPP